MYKIQYDHLNYGLITNCLLVIASTPLENSSVNLSMYFINVMIFANHKLS